MKRVLTEIDCCCWFFTLLSIIQATPINHNQDIGSNIARPITINGTSLDKVCFNENAVYKEGQNFTTTNPCEICICDPPGFSCSFSSCDLKPGCKAIHKANQCCPEYVCECERNGKIYGNGEKVEEPNPCKVCYCKGGEIKCTLVTCYTRDDCEPGYVAGVCCPKYDHCPPLETIKNKSSALMPAIVIISDLKTESASNKDHFKSLAELSNSNHSVGKSTATEYTNTESREISTLETTSSNPSETTITTMSLQMISPSVILNEVPSTVNMDMITASDDMSVSGDSVLDSAAEYPSTESVEMSITSESVTPILNTFTNQIDNTDTMQTQSESLCTENSSEVTTITVSEIDESGWNMTTPQETDSTTAITESSTEDFYSTPQYDNYTLNMSYNHNSSADILVEATSDDYTGSNESSNGAFEFANATSDSNSTLDLVNFTLEDSLLASTPFQIGKSDAEDSKTIVPVEEKSKRNIIAVTVPKNLKKDVDQISKNPGVPAPIVVMISAEQIQFLKLAEEPPIYVENRSPENQKRAQDHLGIVVVPKTTPTTVEMVKVVSGNLYSESNSRDGDLNKAKTINNDFSFNSTGFIHER